MNSTQKEESMRQEVNLMAIPKEAQKYIIGEVNPDIAKKKVAKIQSEGRRQWEFKPGTFLMDPETKCFLFCNCDKRVFCAQIKILSFLRAAGYRGVAEVL